MPGVNQNTYPEFIDITNYPGIYRVLLKQMERQEETLTEIRDALIEHNKIHTNTPKKSKR